jgi:hypothetical protein
MNKPNIPILALVVGYLGAIMNFITEAKSVIGFLAAVVSLIASIYAVALARERLKRLRGRRLSPLKRLVRRLKKLSAQHFLLSTVIVLALSGCATQPGDSPLTKLATIPSRVLDKAATFVTATTTNIVEQAIVTAHETVTLDSATQTLATNVSYTTNLTLITNITAIPKAVIVKSVDTAETAAGFLPPPYGEAAAAGLAIVSTLLAAAVQRRNAMLKTVVQAVEGSGNKAVKENIAMASRIHGTAQEIHTLVKKLTASKS